MHLVDSAIREGSYASDRFRFMHKYFHNILHPPEVEGSQQKRYWVAVACWFFLVVLSIMLPGILGYFVAVSLEENLGSDALRPYEMWVLTILLGLIGGGVFIGNYLWSLIFVKTGFLSPEAVIRIQTNRAPSAKGERIHRRISLSLSVLIPVFLIYVGWYLHSWWFMAVAALLGIWLFISVWAGWKEADALIASSWSLSSAYDRTTRDADKSG